MWGSGCRAERRTGHAEFLQESCGHDASHDARHASPVPGFQGLVRDQGSGFRVQNSGFRIQGSGFRVQGSGYRVQGAGFRVQGPGSRVQG